MSLCLARFALILSMFLLFSGCATAPHGGVPVESTAPSVPVPSSTRFLGKATFYVSATGEKMEVVHDASAGIAIVKLPDGVVVVLPAEIAGAEGRYRDNRMTVWENDGVAVLWIDGKLVFSGARAK